MVVGACNPSYPGDWSRRIIWTQKIEVTVSRDRAIALQLGWQEQNSISGGEKKKSLPTHLSPSAFHPALHSTFLSQTFQKK